jgi:hypothetical protein
VSYPADPVKGGMDILQDVDKNVELPRMQVRIGCRVLNRDDAEDMIVDKDSVGDHRGWVLWPNVPDRRPIPAWAQAWASRVATAVSGSGTAADQFGILPISDYFDYDERWGVKVPTRPRVGAGNSYPLWNRSPRGQVGITLLNTNEHETSDLFMPTDPRIVDVNVAGDPMMGTVVSDLASNNSYDHTRYARVQTAWRVVPMGQLTGNLPGVVVDPNNSSMRLGALAWNLALTGREMSLGRGLVIDQRSAAVPPPRRFPDTPTEPTGGGSPWRNPPPPPQPPPGAPGSGK